MSTPNGRKTDVAVLGWWYGKNYGSILTYYGLNRAIVGLGHTPLMVHEPLGYNGYRVKWPDDILSMKFARRVGYIYTEQAHYSENAKLNDIATTFVVGSDQLWNPHIGRVNDDLFLDFVSPENKRVAYGTSFGNRGTSKFKPEFVEKHSENLGKFDAISVREAYAIDTARDIFGVKATQVVDPVFLLPKSDYDTLADKATTKVDGDYLAVFLLDATLEKKQVAEAIADKLGLDKIVIIPNPDEGRSLAESMFTESRFEILPEDAPENFLHAYRNARYVVTDSFHGSAFAIIFEKPFSSIYNTKRGVDRFVNLLTSLGFGETRRVRESDDINSINLNQNVTFDVDFATSRKTVAADRVKSLEWLQQALSCKLSTNNKISKVREKFATVTNPMRDRSGAASFFKKLYTRLNLDKLSSKNISNVCFLQPKFISNNQSWTIENTDNKTILTVVSGKGEKGNFVWSNLGFALDVKKNYTFTICWSVKTVANVVTVHARNSKNGKFVLVGHIALGEKKNVEREDEISFSVREDGFDQIMFGSSQFTGVEPSIKISKYTIVAEGRSKRSQVKPKIEVAVPLETRSIQTVIDDIYRDNAVKYLHGAIINEAPELELYIGKLLRDYTWNKVGGPADILAFPRNADQLLTAYRLAKKSGINCTVLGLCSNVLVRDGGIRGLVLSTSKMDEKHISGRKFIVSAGSGLTESAFFLQENGKSGLEWAAGIPGTIGGAVYMNAGTNVSDIRKSIDEITFLDSAGNRSVLKGSEVSWGKRHSSFQEKKDWIILSASFNIKDSNKDDLYKIMTETVRKRERHFPLDLPNHGSTFKWWRAPRLISQAGLVGVKIGGAQISTKQPGFMVNLGNATATDYEALINLTIAKVYDFSGFLLEPEVEIIGERLHRYERYNDIATSSKLDMA